MDLETPLQILSNHIDPHATAGGLSLQEQQQQRMNNSDFNITLDNSEGNVMLSPEIKNDDALRNCDSLFSSPDSPPNSKNTGVITIGALEQPEEKSSERNQQEGKDVDTRNINTSHAAHQPIGSDFGPPTEISSASENGRLVYASPSSPLGYSTASSSSAGRIKGGIVGGRQSAVSADRAQKQQQSQQSSGFAGENEKSEPMIIIAKNPKTKNAREKTSPSTTAKQSNNPDFNSGNISPSSTAPLTPPQTEQHSKMQYKVTNSFGPNSEPAQLQLVSMENPESLMSDYIPLPEGAIPSLIFKVVKQHHRMSWLKQTRLIVVTGSEFWNCKESDISKLARDSRTGELDFKSLSVTKVIPFSSITKLSLTSKISFAVHVLGDHTYFYISDHSLEIVWAIRKRMSICAAIAKLVRGTNANTHQLSLLARAFMEEKLTLPQFSAGADFFAVGATSGAGGSTNDGNTNNKNRSCSPSGGLSRSLSSSNSTLTAATLSNDRAASEAFRYASNMRNRMAIIDALKNDVLPEECQQIRSLIDSCSKGHLELVSLHNIRRTMDNVRNSIAEIIINVDERTSKQLKHLPDIFDLSDARAVSDEAIQTVLLSSIYGNVWAALHLQSDLVGLESKFRQQCRYLRSEVSPLELGVPDKCLDFHYDLVLESIRKVSIAKTPHVMLEEITACCKSIVLTISAGTQFGFVRSDLPATVDENGVIHTKVRSGSPAAVASESSTTAASSSSPKKKSSYTLAADDILPILIFLLIHSNVRDLVFVREYITALGDPEEASERTYYFTMFSSAIEYVLASEDEIKRSREKKVQCEEKEKRREERRKQKQVIEGVTVLVEYGEPSTGNAENVQNTTHMFASNTSLEETPVLQLSKGGSLGRFKATHGSNVVEDTTSTTLAEAVEKERLKYIEKEKKASTLSGADTTSGNLALNNSDFDMELSPVGSPAPRSSANTQDKPNPATETKVSVLTTFAAPTVDNASSNNISGSFASNSGASSPFFISPYSSFVQNDLTISQRRQALMRQQTGAKNNKNVTSASSPYSISNLFRSSNESQKRFVTEKENPSSTEDPYQLHRPRGISAPSSGNAGGDSFVSSKDIMSSYKFV